MESRDTDVVGRQFQQGDVLIRNIHTVPSNGKKKDDTIVAYSEVTNHKHEVIGEGVEVFDADGVLYISAPSGGRIQHEEHHPISLPSGFFSVGIVREYDHFAEDARNVAD